MATTREWQYSTWESFAPTVGFSVRNAENPTGGVHIEKGSIMHVSKWVAGEYPESDRTVAVISAGDNLWWQHINAEDEIRGIDPDEIADSAEGLLWEHEEVSLFLYWGSDEFKYSKFNGGFFEATLSFDKQQKHFDELSTLLRGQFAQPLDYDGEDADSFEDDGVDYYMM